MNIRKHAVWIALFLTAILHASAMVGAEHCSAPGEVLPCRYFGDSMMTIPQATPSVQARSADIPAAAWTRPIGLPHEGSGRPRVNVPMIDDGAFNGAPLGGMGAGSIGRTYRGDFARWHLDIGAHRYQPVPAAMFSVFAQQGERRISQALWTDAPNDGTLAAWSWRYPVGAGSYHALYPRSWFTYDWDALPVQLSVEQFSPVIPHNYRESSYPVALFTWTAHNPTNEPVTVGVLFTWQNLLGFGTGQDAAGGQVNEAFAWANGQGVQMRHNGLAPADEWNGTMAIAVQNTPGVRLSSRSRFVTNSDGADIWNDFAADGALDNINDATPSTQGDILGAGVAATFTLHPGQTLTIPFALAWDMPIMTFGSGTSWYKRYTKFYGREGNHAAQMTQDALAQADDWRDQIAAWQQPILDDPERPLWYKTALFNELYFLADGSTAWEAGRVGEPPPPDDDLGGFLYLECSDYLHYGTFDVDFYASFALIELYPEIERRLIADYAHTVPEEDLTMRSILATGDIAPRKRAGSVPHDLGGPTEDPWLMTNNYVFQDVTRWKDLNPKLVLRLYRDAILLEDDSLIRAHWGEASMAMDYIAEMDRDGDGIPENEGIPDQTYDTWPVSGVSAYSGGLWLAALAAMRDMAVKLGETTTAADYQRQLTRATAVYEEKLWNGSYYEYDASTSPYHDSVMADQLAGQWYVDYLGIKLLPDDHVETALRTIHRLNVRAYGDGQMGAVNGMRPDGTIDTSDIQSQEMWTGTSYGLAAFMLMRGLDEEAWDTAYGVYRVTYETSGLWFRTPEGFDVNGNYHASLYMRPLTVWAIETALRLRA